MRVEFVRVETSNVIGQVQKINDNLIQVTIGNSSASIILGVRNLLHIYKKFNFNISTKHPLIKELLNKTYEGFVTYD